MNKKFLTALFVMTIVLVSVSTIVIYDKVNSDADSSSPTVTYSIVDSTTGLKFDLYSDNTATLTGAGTLSGEVIISSKVTYNSQEYTVTKIAAKALSRQNSITKLTIPNTVTMIGNASSGTLGAFAACSSLTEVVFADGSQLETLGDYAFYQSFNLKTITLPSSLKTIGKGVFTGGLVTVYGTDAGVHNRYCLVLSSLTIPSSVESIGEMAFDGCLNLKITVESGNAYYSSDEYGVLFNKDKTTLIFAQGVGGDNYTVPNTVEKIGDRAFFKGAYVSTQIFKHNSVVTANPLTGITLNDGLKEIGNYAFYSAYIKSVDFPSSLMTVGNYAFRTSSLEILHASASTVSYGSYVFAETKLKEVTLNGTFAANDYMFNGCTQLVSADLSGITSDTLNNTFQKCTSLKSFKISSYTTTLQSTFYGCTSLTSVEIPDSVITIGSYSFRDCSSMKGIDLSENLTTIEQYAFYRCTSLENIIIPAKITSIANNAFYYCTSVNFKAIFYDFPSGMTSAAFTGCNAVDIGGINTLTVYKINGDQLDEYYIFLSINTSSSNWTGVVNLSDRVVSATAIFSSNQITEFKLSSSPGDYSLSDDGCVLYNAEKSILLASTSGVNTVALPNTVIKINDYAFYGRSNLISIELNDNLKTIGSYAFMNCTQLSKVKFGAVPSDESDYIVLGSYAFQGCTSLTSVDLRGVINIGSYAFSKCTLLETVTFSDKYVQYGLSSFSGAALKEVDIESGSLSSSVFSGCTYLETVRLGPGVDYMWQYVFMGDTALVNVIFECDSINDNMRTDAFYQLSPMMYVPVGYTPDISKYISYGFSLGTSVRTSDGGYVLIAGEGFSVEDATGDSQYPVIILKSDDESYDWNTLVITIEGVDYTTKIEGDVCTVYFSEEISENVIISASMDYYQCKVTLSEGEGFEIVDIYGSKRYGTNYVFELVPESGYDISEAVVKINDSVLTPYYDNRYVVKMTGDITISVTGVKTLDEYEVTFVIGVTEQKISVTVGSQIVSGNIPVVADKDGYQFKGWYLDKDMINIYDTTSTVTSDLTLYAGWDVQRYTVSFDTDHGTIQVYTASGVEITSGCMVPEGTDLTIVSELNYGYETHIGRSTALRWMCRHIRWYWRISIAAQ